MFGVVLWSDKTEQKAVIWCEDHGDLAFLCQSDDQPVVALDAGDWVQFDVTVERHMRLAHNPRLVTEGAGSDLVGSLEAYRPADGQDDQRLSHVSAEIIPFSAPQPKVTETRERRAAQGA